jgi:low affinity Fe/Cu permease
MSVWPSKLMMRARFPSSALSEIGDEGSLTAGLGIGRRVRSVDKVGAEEARWRKGMFGGAAAHANEWTSRHWSSRLLHRVGEIVSHAGSGIIAAVLVVGWLALGVMTRFPGWWETTLYVATGSVTFVMVFVIQHTQQRQTAATQRKLDELLRSSEPADSKLIAVEEASDADLEALTRQHVAEREQAQVDAG